VLHPDGDVCRVPKLQISAPFAAEVRMSLSRLEHYGLAFDREGHSRSHRRRSKLSDPHGTVRECENLRRSRSKFRSSECDRGP
jgi:hypothetical protein